MVIIVYYCILLYIRCDCAVATWFSGLTSAWADVTSSSEEVFFCLKTSGCAMIAETWALQAATGLFLWVAADVGNQPVGRSRAAGIDVSNQITVWSHWNST